MKKRNIFKKILMFIVLFVFCIFLSSCSSLEMNIKRDGSGTANLKISKIYTDEEGNTKTYTREELDQIVDDIILCAEMVSGMEDRVKLKKVKEYEDYYFVTLKFMRIQYISQAGTGGDFGLYTYKNTTDFIQEYDSVSNLKDYWLYGAYKSLIKLKDNTKYTFKNAKLGSENAKITPTYFDGKVFTQKEIDDFFSENGVLSTDKKGKIFTFFIVDIKGLESVTFNFKGNIKVYASKNVEEVTKSSITVKSISEKATLTVVDQDPITKDVNCFVGFVYLDVYPNYVSIGILSSLGLIVIGLIVYGLIKGSIQRFFKSKKFRIIIKNYDLYIMLVPAMAFLFVFAYLPMGGVVLAFKNYKIYDGIWGSEWASVFGLKNFINLFSSKNNQFGRIFANTFILALLKFIFGFLIAIVLTVLFSYLKDGLFKKSVQTISYFPYFLSWVVISTISYVILATDGGTINKILLFLGKEPINFYASPEYWRFILTFTTMWKTAGYSTIIYLAAIAGIDQSLYEAAKIDGAGRIAQLIHVTIPGLVPVLGIQIVFSLGNLVKDDFDQIYTMIRGSALLRDTTDTIGMIVYENISNAANYSGTAAMGLLQGLIALLLIIISNTILKKHDIQGAY